MTLRKGFIATLVLGVLAAPLAPNAQQPGKIPRIGFLLSGSPPSYSIRINVFRERLRELGYAEGKNIAIEYR